MIILSIDSGIEKTGYAIFSGKKYIKSGLIKTSKKLSSDKRLKQIYDELNKIVLEYKPKKIILERLFFFKNQKTAILVSQSQGVALLVAAQNNISVDFLTPPQIKSIITGYGQADKKAVQKMLRLTPDIPAIKQDDEADAIAAGLAYCYLHKNLLQ